MSIASPFPRLGPQALEEAAAAAGYAQACYFDVGAEAAPTRGGWLSLFPSPASFLLAAWFLVL